MCTLHNRNKSQRVLKRGLNFLFPPIVCIHIHCKAIRSILIPESSSLQLFARHDTHCCCLEEVPSSRRLHSESRLYRRVPLLVIYVQ